MKSTRSKVMTVFMSGIIMAFVVVLSGCGTKPQAAIDAAEAAVKAAEAAEANVYFPNEMKAIQDSLTSINAMISAQESKTFKSFGNATAKLAGVTNVANELAQKTAAKKEEVKKGASDLLAGANAACKEIGDLLKGLPKNVKGIDVKGIEGECAGIQASITEVQGMFDKGNYVEAGAKAQEISKKASDIVAQLKGAVAPKK